MTATTRRIITSPEEIREAIHKKVVAAMLRKFPMKAGAYTLTLSNLHVSGRELTHTEQRHILLSKGSVTEGLYGDVTVTRENGKVAAELKHVRLLGIPWYTGRYTLLVDGNEYAVVNQMRTKPGVYTRKRGNDEIESSFNLSRGANFKLTMDPATGQFRIDILHAVLPALAVLRILRAQPSDILAVLGQELYDANNRTLTSSAVTRTRNCLYDKLVRYKSELGDTVSEEEKEAAIRSYFTSTRIDPETTRLTLGTAYDSVSAGTILDAMRRTLAVYREEEDIDERDHLAFQKIYGVEDLLAETIDKNDDASKKIVAKVAALSPELSDAEVGAAVREALRGAGFGTPMRRFVATSTLSRLPTQINPVEFMDVASIVTRLGEGAISSERAVPFETRGVNYSYIGTIDPIAAPESSKVGIDVHCTYNARKGDDNEFYKHVLNCRTGKTEDIRLIELHEKRVGFPDALYVKEKKSSDIIPAVYRGRLVKVRRDMLDYQIPSPHDLLTVTTSTVPFANANQGNRLLMGDKHIQQALPLKEPETRLVKPKISGLRSGGMLQTLGSFTIPVSPADGVVESIKDGVIVVRDKAGGRHAVDYEDNLPLATKTLLHNDITVRIGDSVRRGQALGTSTFAKDGELAMGRNLTVAYMPFHGLNHEDGVVLSESADKNMTSVHADKIMVELTAHSVIGKDRYRACYPTTFTAEQLENLDNDGVVKEGIVLRYGDPVVVFMEDSSESRLNQVLGKLSKSLRRPYRDASVTYDGHSPAKVLVVKKSRGLYGVVLRIEKTLGVGDKVAGSYGNKGVCSAILPDDRMPRDESGKPVDAVFTSFGVVKRLNPGQILESCLGKVALKRGEPYEIENFSKENYVDFVRNEMKKYRVKDKETLYDPETGKQISGVFVGVQHCHKLMKTSDTNFSALGVEGRFDQDDGPTGSGIEGPKSLGQMEVNALIAHNARALMREGSTLRSAKNLEFWKEFQAGRLPQWPAEKKTFDRFSALLKQAGVNILRRGKELVAAPLTDRDVLALSAGEIRDGRRLNARTLAPEPGGLFDPVVTGGLDGRRWGHISLAEPVVNPVFTDAARAVLNMDGTDFRRLCEEQGGAIVRDMLNNIDVDKELEAEQVHLSGKLSLGAVDKAIKRLKCLRALKDLGLRAGDAYVLSVVPVTPPIMRPISIGTDGSTLDSDANALYKDLILQNNATRAVIEARLGPDDIREARRALNTRLHELAGTVAPGAGLNKARGIKGALMFVSGNTPKEGYFQRKVISGKQTLTGRATISPDVTLGLDEVGLPEEQAWALYAPFVVRQLALMGYDPLSARDAVASRSPAAKEILIGEMSRRPILINRAPTLWRHGILAARPIMRKGNNLHVNSLWEKSTNQDYDGDAMQIHVPVSEAAVQEALEMMPSRQIFSDKKRGALLMQPKTEPVAGLYKATENVGRPIPRGTEIHIFENEENAWKAYYQGKLKMTDYVEIGQRNII